MELRADTFLRRGRKSTISVTVGSNEKSLQRIKKVKCWLDSNKLALNVGKSNFLLFHSPWKKLTEKMDLKVGKHRIQRTNHVTILGVIIDEYLSWKFHITELCKKLSRSAGTLFKVRHHVPLLTLISLFNSLFSSFLNYGILAWGLFYDSYLESLFRMEKKVLRCIKFESFSFPSTPIFQSFKNFET